MTFIVRGCCNCRIFMVWNISWINVWNSVAWTIEPSVFTNWVKSWTIDSAIGINNIQKWPYINIVWKWTNSKLSERFTVFSWVNFLAFCFEVLDITIRVKVWDSEVHCRINNVFNRLILVFNSMKIWVVNEVWPTFSNILDCGCAIVSSFIIDVTEEVCLLSINKFNILHCRNKFVAKVYTICISSIKDNVSQFLNIVIFAVVDCELKIVIWKDCAKARSKWEVTVVFSFKS